MRRIAVVALLLPVLVLCSCFELQLIRAQPTVLRAPLRTVRMKTGTLFPAKGIGATVRAHEASPDDVFRGGKWHLPWLPTPETVLIPGPYYIPHPAKVPEEARQGDFRWTIVGEPGKVADFFQKAGKAVAISLGFEEGTDLMIEISITRFRIDTYQFSEFKPMECIGYGEIETSLKSRDGALLRNRVSRVVYWEDTYPVVSYKEVAKEAISRIYTHAAWESMAGVLQEQYPSGPDTAALGRLLQVARGEAKGADRREAVFWLGLAGKSDPAVADGLLELFRTSTKREVAKGAAEALGMLGAPGAREELEAVLSGSRNLPGWQTNDTENVWYLLKALHLLGRPHLEKDIPASLRGSIRLSGLVSYLETEAFPELTPDERQNLEELKLKPQK